MSKGITNKTRLLQSASTLLVIVGAAGMAHAADVQVQGVVTVNGDIVGSAKQANTTAATAASTNADNTLTVTATTDGTATIDKAVSGATTIVNTSTQTISDSDDETATDKVALGTSQSSTGAAAIVNGATTSDTDVVLTTGVTGGSTVTLSNSLDAASATTNTATQRVTLDSTTLLSTGTTSATADTVIDTVADVDASGAVVLGSLQTTTLTSTIANTTGSTIALTVGGATTSSALDLTGNTQNANATGSTAANAIGLSGTTVGVGIAIASQQDSDAGSAVTAATTASTGLTATTLGTGSTATVSGNLIQAKALSANTDNNMSVAATSVTLPASDATKAAVLTATSGTVSGAFATVNDQSVLNDTSATVDAETAGLVNLSTTGAVTGGSALVNEANTLTARAQGAVTTNTTNLTIGGTLGRGTTTTTDIANGAVIANLQSIAAGADVNADVDGGTTKMITTTVGAALTDSSTSTSANRIQALADGAVATNRLAVSATTLSVAPGATATPGVDYNGTTSNADTAFAVANQQISGVSAITADVEEAAGVSVAVTGVTSGSEVKVDGNIVDASALSNKATNSLSLAGTTVATDAGLLNVQNSAAGVTATVEKALAGTALDAGISTTLADITNSALTSDGNLVRASAQGNTAGNTLIVAATTLDGASNAKPVATTLNTADVSALADYSLANSQILSGTGILAADLGSKIAVTTGAGLSSSLQMANNAQDTSATGNTATNGIGLSGTTMDVGAAIASQQGTTATANVTATTLASASLTAASMGTGSTATVSGNVIQARALSANTSNAISVDATTVTLPTVEAGVSPVATLASTGGTAKAGFTTLNEQNVAGDTLATINAEAATTSAIKLAVTGGVTGGSELVNDANSLTARAQGAVTTNTTNLNIGGTLSSGTAGVIGIANGAVIANLQTIAAGANVEADIGTTTGTADLIKTTVGGALTASSLSTSANRIQAFADGANATNNLAVSATTISAAAEVTGAPKVGTTAAGATSTADTAFAVANAQIAGNATVTAKIDEPATISSLVTGIASDSNVTLNGNVVDAFGVSNKATNGLSLTGTTIATDAGVLNVQSSDAQVASTIGTGADATTAASRADAGVIAEFDANVSGSAIAVNSNVTRGSAIGNVGNNTLAVSATTLSGGGTLASAAAVGSVDGIATATGDYSLANSQSLGDASSSTTNVAAAYGIDAGGLIAGTASTNSRLSVSSNNQFAEALGNSGTNRIALSATGAGAAAGVDPTAALSNVQDGNAAEIASTSKMTVFANAESSASSVALNGNSNTALGVINNAVNSVGVSAVTLDGSATVGGIVAATNTTTADYALNSVQGASGTLASTARSDISNLDFASTDNTGITGSAITMTGNATTAEGSANRVSNALSASATDNGATAGLNNSQASDADVTVNAVSTVGTTLAGVGIVVAATNSSISVDGNSTTALARGNSASNALNYNDTSYSGPTTLAAITDTTSVAAAISMRNGQTNSGALNATSTGAAYNVSLDAAATVAAGALNSSAKLANNTVAANGFGNVASNSMNVTTAGANAPSAVVLNAQSNDATGTVTTLATGTTFTLALNSDGIGATNSNAMMTNNTVSSNAYGNMAMNNVTMASFGAGVASSAVSSIQSNSAAISATATNVTFGMTVGSNSGSALRSNGNNTTVQAVANSSVNSINGGM